MKKHRRIFTLALTLLLALAALPGTALAAGAEGTEPAQGAQTPPSSTRRRYGRARKTA